MSRGNLGLAALLALLPLAACEEQAPTANARIVAEGPAGRSIEIPCYVDRQAPIVSDGGMRFPALLTDHGRGDSVYGPFRGLSGAPVFLTSGEWIGAFSTVFSDGEVGRYCGITPCDSLDAVWEHARVRARAPLRTSAASEDVRPGTSVGIAWIWGDMFAGDGGYVCERRGDEVVALGHRVTAETGPCSFALVRAPMLGASKSGGEWQTLSRWGEVIGAVDFNSEGGVHAVLGATPSYLKVEYVVNGSDPTKRLTYFVAKCPSQWSWNQASRRVIWTTATNALARIEGIERSRSFKVRVSGQPEGWKCQMHVSAEGVEALINLITARCFEEADSILGADQIELEVTHGP